MESHVISAHPAPALDIVPLETLDAPAVGDGVIPNLFDAVNYGGQAWSHGSQAVGQFNQGNYANGSSEVGQTVSSTAQAGKSLYAAGVDAYNGNWTGASS